MKAAQCTASLVLTCLFSLCPVPAEESPARVTLNVVVNDKAGSPVAGLPQSEFTVLDNKQPQKLLSFQAIAQTRPADSASEVVLVIDTVNTSFGRVAFERDQIKKFLQQDAAQLSRPVSIDFFTDSGLKIQREPTRDGNALTAYLDENETGLRAINRSQGFYGAVDRAQLSLHAVAELSAYEQQRPGRKIVIWISPGWPVLSGPNIQLTNKDEQNVYSSIIATSTQLRLAGITLYSVDPSGTDDSGSFRTFYYEQFLKSVTAPKQAQFGNLALQVLADHSGGRVLNSNNNIAGEIEQCVRDFTSYYVLSYDPSDSGDRSQYHAIEVKMNQRELKAQTQYGYYSQAPEK